MIADVGEIRSGEEEYEHHDFDERGVFENSFGGREKYIWCDEEGCTFEECAPADDGDDTSGAEFPNIVTADEDDAECHDENTSEISYALMCFEVFQDFFVKLRMEQKSDRGCDEDWPDDLGECDCGHY